MKKQSDWIFSLINKKKVVKKASSLEFAEVILDHHDFSEDAFMAFESALAQFGLEIADLDEEGGSDQYALGIKKGKWSKADIKEARESIGLDQDEADNLDVEKDFSGEMPKAEEPKKEDTCSGDMPPTMPQ